MTNPITSDTAQLSKETDRGTGVLPLKYRGRRDRLVEMKKHSISEVTRLRLCDIHSDQGFIFIKGSKQKKDRRTVLSVKLLDLLRTYYREHKPSYWLFEGADGGQYSTSSINKIFQRMVQSAKISTWATPHTLRHSYATHLLEAGTHLCYIQGGLGHSKFFTLVLAVSHQSIKSPLDALGCGVDLREVYGAGVGSQ